jgi:hypothetical protein
MHASHEDRYFSMAKVVGQFISMRGVESESGYTHEINLGL